MLLKLNLLPYSVFRFSVWATAMKQTGDTSTRGGHKDNVLGWWQLQLRAFTGGVKLWLYGLHQAYVVEFSILICTLELLKYTPSSATINSHPLPVWQTVTGAEAEQELILVNEN